jgi:hypothetical protein
MTNGKVSFRSGETITGKFLRAVYRHYVIDYPKFFKMDNLSKLGFLGAELLVRDTDLLTIYKGDRIGIILANSSSSLETDEKHQESINDRNNYYPSPSVFVYTLPNIMAGEISIQHKIQGENTVFISEQFDPAFTCNYISDLFLNKHVDCCIGGWVECYSDRYESFLFLAETAGSLKRYQELEENIIFAPSNIQKLYKGESR